MDTKTHELKVLVYELATNGFPSITTAQTGMFHDRNWVLFDGVYQELDEHGFVEFESRFERMEIVTEQEGEVYFGNQRCGGDEPPGAREYIDASSGVG